MPKLYTFGPPLPKGMVSQTNTVYHERLDPPFTRLDMIVILRDQFPRAGYERIKNSVDADIALGVVVDY